MVRWCIRLTRLTLDCEVIRYCLVKSDKISKKDFSGWRPAIAFLYFFLSFSPSSYFLSFSMQKSRHCPLQVHFRLWDSSFFQSFGCFSPRGLPTFSISSSFVLFVRLSLSLYLSFSSLSWCLLCSFKKSFLHAVWISDQLTQTFEIMRLLSCYAVNLAGMFELKMKPV